MSHLHKLQRFIDKKDWNDHFINPPNRPNNFS